MAENPVEAHLELLIASAVDGLTVGQLYNLGGQSVSVQSNATSVLDSFKEILGHLVCKDPFQYLLRVVVCANQTLIPQLEKSGYQSQKFDAFLDFHAGVLIVTQVAESTTWVFCKSNPFSYGRPDRVRTLLQVIASKGTTPVHGGTVAWPGSRGLLISAKGGSGKSTAVAVAVAQGATTVGDDFILTEPLDMEGRFVAWSLFSSVRLSEGGPANGLFSSSEYPSHEGKKIYNLHLRYPGRVVQSFEIGTIVVPSFSSKNFARPLAKTSALRAVAPSSVGLARDKAGSLKEVINLVEGLPTIEVGLTTNLEQNNKFLRELAEK